MLEKSLALGDLSPGPGTKSLFTAKNQKEIFGSSTSPFKEGRMEMSQERHLIFSRLNYCKEQPSSTTSAMVLVVVV